MPPPGGKLELRDRHRWGMVPASSANKIATGRSSIPPMPFGQRGFIAMRKAPPSTLAGPQVFPRETAEATWQQ